MTAAALAAFFIAPVQAQQPVVIVCGERVMIVQELSVKFGETVRSSGLSSNGSLFEVFATGDGATWTILITQPNGRSCVYADGEHWRASVGKKEKEF